MTRSGGYATGRARREQIVGSAAQLFARVGYRSATIPQIAEHVGISRTGLLHHFPTKETLLAAVLALRDAEDIAFLADDENTLGTLDRLVDLARRNTQQPHLVALFAVLSAEAGDPEHPAHDYFVGRYERARARLVVLLRRADEAGLLADGVDPAGEATSLVALMDGLQVQWLLAPDRVDMPALLAQRLDSLVRRPQH